VRAIRLGAGVVMRLLPHRRPLLLVDFIDGYQRAPQPRLTAGRHIAADEEVFAGHFPGLPIWPGVYTLEGLAQTCQLLAVILHLQRGCEARGRDPDEALAALAALDRASRLATDAPAPSAPSLASPASLLEELTPERLGGVSAAVNARFYEPVLVGQRLDYAVALTHEAGAVMRFDVEATVEGRPVARGTQVIARRELPAPP
jgi:3-hydroxyacyl-[acyl-carrier-protein] dehydratase